MTGRGVKPNNHGLEERSARRMEPDHRAVSAVRVPELAVGLFIVAASIAGAVFWQRSVESGTAILVTSRDVARGSVLTLDDISEVTVKTTGDIALIRSSAAPQVVGRRVIADLRSGTPLVPAFMSLAGVLGALDGLVGLTIRQSSAPSELASGDVVRIFTVVTNFEGEVVVDEVPGPLIVWDVSVPDPMSNERAVTVKSPLPSIPLLVGREQVHLVKVQS